MLLTSKDYSNASIKICDLGCCRVSKTNRQITRALVGTLEYMAPEVTERPGWLGDLGVIQVIDGDPQTPLIDGTKVDVSLPTLRQLSRDDWLRLLCVCGRSMLWVSC